MYKVAPTHGWLSAGDIECPRKGLRLSALVSPNRGLDLSGEVGHGVSCFI